MSTARQPRPIESLGHHATHGPRDLVIFLRRMVLEVTIIGALFVLYNLGRLAIHGHESTARAHAELVRRMETVMHLPSEASTQDAVAALPHLFEVANRYYVGVHFPVMIVFLLWGLLARPRLEYVWARNLLVTMTFAGLAIHTVFPLAPPRMFPEWGFTDTMAVWGPSAYEGASAAVANQYAAMPSLHIGWAVLIAFVLVRTGPRPLALVGVVHAVITVFVVVITANHWWFDGIVATSMLGLAILVFPHPQGTRLPSFARSRPGSLPRYRKESSP